MSSVPENQVASSHTAAEHAAAEVTALIHAGVMVVIHERARDGLRGLPAPLA